MSPLRPGASSARPSPDVGAVPGQDDTRDARPSHAYRRTQSTPAGRAALDRIALLAARLLDVASSQISRRTGVHTTPGSAGPLGSPHAATDRRAAEDRADRVLASVAIGYLGLDQEFRVTYVNPEARRLLGRDESDTAGMIGRTIWELFPVATGGEYGQAYRRVAETRVPESIEAYYPAPFNARFEVRIVPAADGIALNLLDVTARHDADRLVEVSNDAAGQLVGVTTIEQAVSVLARVVVPRLADWAIVSLLEPDGAFRDVQTRHVDPELEELLGVYAAARRGSGGTDILDRVVVDREPNVITHDVVDVVTAFLRSPDAVDALRRLEPASAAVVPLVTDGTVVGVLTMARGALRPPMNEQELAVATATCRRVALAIENAQLQAQRLAVAAHDRTVAQALQQALLTALPLHDHLILTARYLTAADGDQVGGDWYDAVVSDGGATTVMIGDVAGHDIAAAAVMGQLRTILRVFALQDDETPARMLQQLDHAAHALSITTTATVIAARIEQTAAQRVDGQHVLRWSNAGHPPPILLHPDGRSEVLHRGNGSAPDGPRDTWIGIVPDRTRHDFARDIAAGSCVLLYTDGLIETRTRDVDAGVAQLRAALLEHHSLAPGDMLDAVIADMVGGRPDDDVAVLAVTFGSRTDDRFSDASHGTSSTSGALNIG